MRVNKKEFKELLESNKITSLTEKGQFTAGGNMTWYTFQIGDTEYITDHFGNDTVRELKALIEPLLVKGPGEISLEGLNLKDSPNPFKSFK